METFPHYWPFVRGIHRSPVNSPHKGQWRGALIFFICAWTNGWVNNRGAGDLRLHRAHHDVIVLVCQWTFVIILPCRNEKGSIVEILLNGRKETAYIAQSLSFLLMTWWRDEPGHEPAWHGTNLQWITIAFLIRKWQIKVWTKHRVVRNLACLQIMLSWWRHQMETFSALLAICAGNSPVPGEFPTQRPVTRSFDVSFYLRPNKHSWCWWFETPSRPLWRHRNVWRDHDMEVLPL